MPSLAVRVADAVTAALNAGTFSRPFTAQREYLPRYELKSLKDLKVTAVPKTVAITTAARGQTQHDVSVDVAVQQKLQTVTDVEVDELMGLADEIADFFRFKRLADPSAAWVGTEHEPIYAPEHLEQLRQFTSVMTLTFRVIR